MSVALAHRGPDDEGTYCDEATGVALGARRLSIIDIPGGRQPRSNEDGTVWAAFNGEIYNHPALRQQLLASGHRLEGRSDTEVLPHLYEEYGDDLVHALDGMFALAIWDSRRRRLLLARDRFGEKPLFYSERGGNLTFASELTALTRGLPSTPDVDPRALDSFFVFGYVPGPGSILESVRQVRPGHVLSWDRDSGRSSERRYWRPPVQKSAGSESVEDLAAEAGRLLESSVKSRLIADVPIGVFLSGGVDSTLIAAIAAEHTRRPLKTYTVGYDLAERDERPEARAIAALIGTEHHELRLSGSEVAPRVSSLLAELDQPLADQAIVPLHAVAQLAKQDVTVAIGGEGADELFGGYPRYGWLQRAPRNPPRWMADAAPSWIAHPSPASGRARRALDLAVPRPVVERHLDWVSGGRRHIRDEIYGPQMRSKIRPRQVEVDLAFKLNGYGNGSVAGSMMLLDQQNWLPDDVLFKADRAGMLVSLEIRTPYLQRELAEFAASVRPDLHVKKRGKLLLRQLLSERLSDAPLRRKEAFLPPASEWLRGPLEQVLRSQVRSGSLFREGWFEPRRTADMVDQHIAGSADWTHVLWPLLAAGLWLDRFREPSY